MAWSVLPSASYAMASSRKTFPPSFDLVEQYLVTFSSADTPAPCEVFVQ